MTKCKRKLLPAEPYEIDALESWFSDLSAEGLHVQKANALYATFTEGEKKRLLFRMEPKQDGIFPALDESKAEERNAQHREKGWSFVCGLNRFYVYAAEEGTADYFATPQEEGAYYPDNLKGNKALNNRYTELLLTLLMIAGFIYITLRLTTYEWVTGSTSPVCNPAFLLLVIFSGQRIRGAIRLQNSLAAGEPHHQPTDWQAPHLRRKHWLYQVWMLGMITFLLLPFLPNVFSFSDRPIAEVKQPLPMISLAELENDPDFYAVDSYYQRDGNAKEDWWEREANLVNSYPTFGSPVDLAYNQAGRIRTKQMLQADRMNRCFGWNIAGLRSSFPRRNILKNIWVVLMKPMKLRLWRIHRLITPFWQRVKIIQGYIWFRGRRFWNWTITMAMQI